MKPFLFIALFALMSLVGCKSVEYRVVQKTEYVYLGIPGSLTTPIKPNPPPSKEEFVSAKASERTQLCMDYAGDLMGSTKQLNDRLVEITKLQAKNQQTVDQMNAAETKRVNEILQNKVKELRQ